MTALRVEALEAGYEPGLPIVRGASLSVELNEILAVLGPNGAGKSTLIKAIAGLVPISAGRVLLHDREITGRAAHRLPHEGLGFVPQTENVFVNLSIDDNLDLAASILKVPKKRRLGDLYALFPDLARQRRLLAGRLSGVPTPPMSLVGLRWSRPRRRFAGGRARGLVSAQRVNPSDEPADR